MLIGIFDFKGNINGWKKSVATVIGANVERNFVDAGSKLIRREQVRDPAIVIRLPTAELLPILRSWPASTQGNPHIAGRATLSRIEHMRGDRTRWR